MAEVTNRNLANSRLLVGPKFDRVRGQASEGISIAPVEDEGGIMVGNQGDSMVWSKELGGVIITVNVLPASRAIKALLNATKGGPAPFKYIDGEYSIFGTYVVQNRGEVTSTNNPRTIVLACALIKDSNEAVGEVVQVA